MNKDTDIFLNMNKNYSYWSSDGSWVQKSHHMVSKSSEEAADSDWFLMRLPWGGWGLWTFRWLWRNHWGYQKRLNGVCSIRDFSNVMDDIWSYVN